MSASRIRVAGILSRGSRGLMLNTTDEAFWIVESDLEAEDLIGSTVVVEGVTAGYDRLKADWIGASHIDS